MANDRFDWAILETPDVESVIERASSKIAREYKLVEDDLRQEARCLVADRKRDLAEMAREPDLLKYRLEQDLVNLTEREVRNRGRHTSYEERYSGDVEAGDFAPRPAQITIRQEVGGYTRELVECLLPAVWDESYCYGMRIENAPDADMPRGWSNKSTGNTLAAHIADIKSAWPETMLSDRERRALVLRYGLDWTQMEIARTEHVDQATVSRRVKAGVGKIVEHLNGCRLLSLAPATADQLRVAA